MGTRSTAGSNLLAFEATYVPPGAEEDAGPPVGVEDLQPLGAVGCLPRVFPALVAFLAGIVYPVGAPPATKSPSPIAAHRGHPIKATNPLILPSPGKRNLGD